MSDIGVKVDILPQISPDAIQSAISKAASGMTLNIGNMKFGVDNANLQKEIHNAVSAALNNSRGNKFRLDVDTSQFTGSMKKQMSSLQSAYKSAMTKALKSGNTARVDELSTAYNKMILKAENATKITSSGARRAAEASKQEFISLLSGINKSDAAIKKFNSSIKSIESRTKKLNIGSVDTQKVTELNNIVQNLRNNVSGLGNTTSREFNQMAGAIDRSIQKAEQLATEIEQSNKLYSQSMKPVDAIFSSVTNKMNRNGNYAKQAQFNAAYEDAASATKKSVLAGASGNAASIASASAAADQAQQKFFALGREIEQDNSAIQSLKRTLSSLDGKFSLFDESGTADNIKLNEMKVKIEDLRDALSRMGASSGGEFEELRTKANEAAEAAGKIGRELTSESKDITTDLRSVYNLLTKIRNFESKNPNVGSDTVMSARLNQIKREAEEMTRANIGSASRIKELQNRYAAFEYGAQGDGYDISSGKGSASSRIASLLKNVSGTMVLYEGFQKAKQAARAMYESIVSVDDAMTQLKIVTGATGSEMERFFTAAASTASDLGHSVSEVMGSIETFSRLGYKLQDALSLSTAATTMSNVADTGVDEATTGLTSIIKGYGLQASDASSIADKLTSVGKDYAVSAAELMEALERGGSSLAAANSTLDESIALIAAGNASVQDAKSVGTTLKTVSARIRGSEASKEEIEEMGDDYDHLVASASKYREEIKALSGVDIMQDENTYKSPYKILKEISEVWNQMTDVSQAALLERLGGKRNMNVLMSIIQNIDDLTGAYEDSATSAGTAAEANDIYMDSITGKIGQLKAQGDIFSNTVLDSDMIKPFIDGATDLLSILTSIAGVLGKLGPIIPIAGIAAAGKGVVSLAKDLQNTDSIIGSLSKKIVGFSDKSKGVLSSLASVATAHPAAAVGVIAGAATAAIAAYSVYVNSFTAKYKEFQSNLQESQKLSGELDALNTRISENQDKINRLEELKAASGNLSAVDQAELSTLQAQTAELEQQRAIKEALAKAASDSAANSAADALTTDKWNFSNPFTEGEFGISKEKPYERLETLRNDYKEYQKIANDYESQLADLAKKGKTGTTEYQKIQGFYDQFSGFAQEKRSELVDEIAVVSELYGQIDRSTASGKELAALIEKQLNPSNRMLLEEPGSTIYDSIKELMSGDGMSTVNNMLTALAASGTITGSSVVQLGNDYAELDAIMRTNGITANEIANYYNNAADSSEQFSGETASASRLLAAYSDDIQRAESDVGTLQTAYEKLQAGTFTTSDYATLLNTFPELAEGVDVASGSFEGLAGNIRAAEQSAFDPVIDKLQTLKDTATTDIQVKAIDAAIEAIKQLGNAAETTSDQYGGMARVVHDANTYASGTTEILNGSESNQGFLTDVSAFEQIQKYQKGGATGLGNMKYWQLLDRIFSGYNDVNIDNVAKLRNKAESDTKKWKSVLKAMDKDGNLTSSGAQEFLKVFSENKDAMETIKNLGDDLSYNSKTGEWNIEIAEDHFDVLAEQLGLTTDAFKDFMIQVSQFLDIDWNDNGAASYFSRLKTGLVGGVVSDLPSDGYSFTEDGLNIKFNTVRQAASQMGISIEDFLTGIEKETGMTVKVIDDETGKVIDENKQKRQNAISKNSDRRNPRKQDTDTSKKDSDQKEEKKSSKKEEKKSESKDKSSKKENPKITPEVDTSKAEEQTNKLYDGIKSKAKETESAITISGQDAAMAAATSGMKLEDYISALEKETHKDVVIDIDSDTTKLDNGIKQSKDKAQQDPAKVPVEVDDSGFKDKRTFTRSDGKTVTVNVDADTSKADEAIGRTFARSDGKVVHVDVDPYTSKAEQKIEALGGEKNPAVVPVEADSTSAEQKINTISSSGGSPAVVPVDADTSAAQNKISSVANNPPTVKLNVDMQAPGADEMFSSLGSSGQIQVTADTSGVSSAIKNAIPDKTVSVQATVAGEDKVKSLIAAIQSLRGKVVAVAALVVGKGLVDSLKSAIADVKSKTVTITTNKVTNVTTKYSSSSISSSGSKNGVVRVDGTAHANGTAYAKGNWGAKDSGTALGGELGEELVVRDGKFFTIGSDSAEFFKYRRNDIIE